MGGSIQFAKDDQPVVLDAGCAHCQLDISNEGQASLTINRVSRRDQGHWQCWRLDREGQVKQRIPILQLQVSNSPELPILFANDKELLGGSGHSGPSAGGPIGSSADASVSVRENELVTFKCLIRGASTPVDYVQWMLDSSQNVTHLSQLMMEYSAQEASYLAQSVLKLNATKAMNLKSVSCLSNHQLWLTPMAVSAFLNVLYEPSFTISREPGFGVPVSEGATVILKCEIDSNPSSAPVWIRDAETGNKSSGAANAERPRDSAAPAAEPIVLETQEDGSMVFAPARRSDSGWYRCKTENKYGNFSSFGYYLNVRAANQAAPSGAQTLANQAAGQRARQLIGHPQAAEPSTRLLGPNQPAAQVAPAPQNFLVQPRQQLMSAQTSSNMINNDQPAQADSRCPGGPPTPARGGLEGAPEIERPSASVQAVLGRQLVLPLRFCCNPGPARVFWIHRHLAMIPGRMFGPYITRDVYTTYNSLHCYESTFEIEAVKPEDIGTVYVFVTNEKGHAGAQIHIQLAKQSSNVFDLSPQQRNNNNNNQLQALGTRFHLLAGAASSAAQLSLNWSTLACLIGVSLIVQLASMRQQKQPQLSAGAT